MLFISKLKEPALSPKISFPILAISGTSSHRNKKKRREELQLVEQKL
jgi:hypothetical protein